MSLSSKVNKFSVLSAASEAFINYIFSAHAIILSRHIRWCLINFPNKCSQAHIQPGTEQALRRSDKWIWEPTWALTALGTVEHSGRVSTLERGRWENAGLLENGLKVIWAQEILGRELSTKCLQPQHEDLNQHSTNPTLKKQRQENPWGLLAT